MCAETVEQRKSRAATRRRLSKRARERLREKIGQDFYGSALDAAEGIELEMASKMEGLDAEVAVLRKELRTALAKQPVDMALMLKGMDMLVKAVSVRYRLSKKAEQHLSDSLAGVIRGVGRLMAPEAIGDE